MHRTLRALVVASTLAMPSLAQANLLTNPGFETGTLTGWGTSGNVSTLECSFASPGCPAGFGDWIATLNDSTYGVGNASLTQSVTITGPGVYEFGAWMAFATSVEGGNFSQGQISLTVQGQGISETLGFDPNSLVGQFTITGGGGLKWTEWREVTGTLTYNGAVPVDLLININVQNFDPAKPLALDVDNVFIRAAAAPVPEPASLALLGAGLLGLAAFRRRRI